MKNTMRMRKALGAQKRLTLEELMESGTVVVGSAKKVRDELSRLRDQTRAGKLITMLQFGVLPDELTRRNMELFVSEVCAAWHSCSYCDGCQRRLPVRCALDRPSAMPAHSAVPGFCPSGNPSLDHHRPSHPGRHD